MRYLYARTASVAGALTGLLLFTACAGGGTAAPAVTVTVTATATETVTASPSPDPTAEPEPAADPLDGLFDKGYPKVVDNSELPDYMRSSADSPQSVAIAPGVWTAYVEGIDPKDLAIDGSPFGLCAAVAKWERTLVGAGFDTQGSTCW